MSTIAELPLVAAAPASKSSRWAGLDLARLVASLAIIWIHVPRSEALLPTTLWARFAVPFFTCVAVFFIFEKTGPDRLGSWWQYAASRVRRIYLPFLAWCAVYLAFKGMKKFVAPEQDNDFGGWEMLWWGSAYHLWFLPFILVVSLAAFPLAAWSGGKAGRRIALAIVGAAAGFAVACVPCPANWLGHENGRCIWETLPAVGWGIALAVILPRQSRQSRVAVSIGLTLFFVSLLALGYADRNTLLENMAGLGFAVLALTWSPSVRLVPVSRLGGLAYGIYCSHLLFVKTAEAVGAKLHWPVCPGFDLAIFLIAAVASVACAWLLSRYRSTRWLVA